MHLLQKMINISNLIQENGLDISNLPNLPVHVHCKDRASKYIVCNDRTAQDIGFKNTNEIQGYTDSDFWFLSGNESASIRQYDKQVITKKQSMTFIEVYSLADDKKYIFISHKAPLRGYSKKIIGIATVALVIPQEEPGFCNTSMFTELNNSLSHLVESPELTKRQADCLYLLVQGMTMKQIAKKLNLSPKTIEHYIDHLKSKLNCYSRHELVSKALEINWIKNKLLNN